MNKIPSVNLADFLSSDPNKKQKFIKFISLFVLVAMFAGYYLYMSKEFEQKQKIEQETLKAEKIRG